MASTDKLDKLEGSWSDIEGWCSPACFPMWRYLLRKQREFGSTGHVMEVGAWKGKSASILAAHLDTARSERLLIVDQQVQAEAIESALKLAGLDDLGSVHLHQADSKSITVDDLGIRQYSVRWLHIDGEHSATALFSDLDLAHQLVTETGIVVVDDFFSYAFPQVTFSSVEYLNRYRERFVPFLMGFSKLYLCRPGAAFWYKQHVAIQIVRELEKSGHAVTLTKSTYPEDLDCFAVHDYKGFESVRGPDWDQSNIMVSRRFNHEQLKELDKTPKADS